MHENAFGNGICKMASILSQPQCVNPLAPERCGSKLTGIFLKLILQIDLLRTPVRPDDRKCQDYAYEKREYRRTWQR